jgi:hypothetical protein
MMQKQLTKFVDQRLNFGDKVVTYLHIFFHLMALIHSSGRYGELRFYHRNGPNRT